MSSISANGQDSLVSVRISQIKKANEVYINLQSCKAKDSLNTLKIANFESLVSEMELNESDYKSIIVSQDSVIVNQNEIILNKDLIIEEHKYMLKNERRTKTALFIIACITTCLIFI